MEKKGNKRPNTSYFRDSKGRFAKKPVLSEVKVDTRLSQYIDEYETAKIYENVIPSKDIERMSNFVNKHAYGENGYLIDSDGAELLRRYWKEFIQDSQSLSKLQNIENAIKLFKKRNASYFNKFDRSKTGSD